MRLLAPRVRSSSREIVVPASIANLGPGLDTLGLAVSLYLRVRVTSLIDVSRDLGCVALEVADSGVDLGEGDADRGQAFGHVRDVTRDPGPGTRR